MKIGIIGTRGVPNHYGGFEQFAEIFSVEMVKRGHEVWVYASHSHPYKKDEFKGVRLIKRFDPEFAIGTAGQFIYDFNCIWHSRKMDYDVILQLGYTSSSIWSWLFPAKPLLVTNMDGLEWKRAKYGKLTRIFLKQAEKWAVKYNDKLIADSRGIQTYLYDEYGIEPAYIPYGASLYDTANANVEELCGYGLSPQGYDMLIARFEPENNIEMVLEAYSQYPNIKLVLIGNYKSGKYGKELYRKYSAYEHLVFIGPLYDMPKLDALRSHSRLYIHGHSVGGTNPSLLEAMGSNALICAHDNIFNRAVLGEEAFYFSTSNKLLALLKAGIDKDARQIWIANNRKKISRQYSWEHINDLIESCFMDWLTAKDTQGEVSAS